jgi:hypothetical protein
MNYKILVDFDDETADVVKSRTYFQALKKYDATSIGHEKTKTSSMFISSEKPLNLEELSRDLENIGIFAVRKTA